MTRKRKRESDLTDGQDVAPVPEHEAQGPPALEVDYVPETPPPPDSGGEEEVEGMLGRPGPAAAAERDEPPIPSFGGVIESESAEHVQMARELDGMDLQYPSSRLSSPQPMDVDDPLLLAEAAPSEPMDVVNVDEDVSIAVAPSSFYGSASEGHVENGKQVLEIADDVDDDDDDEGEGANISSEFDKT